MRGMLVYNGSFSSSAIVALSYLQRGKGRKRSGTFNINLPTESQPFSGRPRERHQCLRLPGPLRVYSGQATSAIGRFSSTKANGADAPGVTLIRYVAIKSPLRLARSSHRRSRRSNGAVWFAFECCGNNDAREYAAVDLEYPTVSRGSY